MSRDPRHNPPGHGFRGPLPPGFAICVVLIGSLAFWAIVAAIIFGVRYL